MQVNITKGNRVNLDRAVLYDHVHDKLTVRDTRDTNPLPNELGARTLSTFFNNQYGHTWMAGITIAGWTPDSGYQVMQLAAPASTADNDRLMYRVGRNATWGVWRELLHSGNMPPLNYLPLTGGTLTGSLTIYGSYRIDNPATLGTTVIFKNSNATSDWGSYFRDHDSGGNVAAIRLAKASGVFKYSPDEVTWYDILHAGNWTNYISLAWADITGKPTTFPPSAHTQAWSTITGVPTTFPPETHTHSYLPLSGGTLTGSITSTLFVANNPANIGQSRFYRSSSASSDNGTYIVDYDADTTNYARFRFGYSQGANISLQRVTAGSQEWLHYLLHTGNMATLITPTDVGAAPATHYHDYLPLTGGTLTGDLVVGDSSAARVLDIGAARIRYNTGGYFVMSTGATSGGLIYLRPNRDADGVGQVVISETSITHRGAALMKAADLTWDNVTSKPTTFPPSTHSHSYLPLTGGSLSGSLTVNGCSFTSLASHTHSAVIQTSTAATSDALYGVWQSGAITDYVRVGQNTLKYHTDNNTSNYDILHMGNVHGLLGVNYWGRTNNVWITDAEGKQRFYLGNSTQTSNQVIIRAGGTAGLFQLRNSANSVKFSVDFTNGAIMEGFLSVGARRASSCYITSGTASPTGGVDGDIYIQY